MTTNNFSPSTSQQQLEENMGKQTHHSRHQSACLLYIELIAPSSLHLGHRKKLDICYTQADKLAGKTKAKNMKVLLSTYKQDE